MDPNGRLRVLSVVGTRPETIKMAPLIRLLCGSPRVCHRLAVTGQHRGLLDQVLQFFSIIPDFDLHVMRENQTLDELTCRILPGIGKIMDQVLPDLVLVHGDTTTAFVTSLAAFYRRSLVGHVEAGLRTGDPLIPYPEEMNRRLIGSLAGLHFAPTVRSEQNLLKENVPAGSIYVTGNTVIDAVQMAVSPGHRFSPDLEAVVRSGRRIILVTAHRRENWGDPMRSICRGLCEVAREAPDAAVVFPVHPNPQVRETVEELLGGDPRFTLVSPLEYGDMANLMARSFLVMTDSGGLQEEAPALGVPVLVLREKTERPEAVEAGTVELVGVSADRIATAALRLLTDQDEYRRMAHAVNPYGDGHAAERILQAVLFRFGLVPEGPRPLPGPTIS